MNLIGGLADNRYKDDPWDEFPIHPYEVQALDLDDAVPPLSTWSEFDVSDAAIVQLTQSCKSENDREFFTSDVCALRMLFTYIDFFQAVQRQALRAVISRSIEKQYQEREKYLVTVEQIIQEYFVSHTPLTRSRWIARLECINWFKAARNAGYRRKKLRNLRLSLERAFISKQEAMNLKFNSFVDSIEDEGGYRHSLTLEESPETESKLWSFTETQRMRSGLIIFGRDYPSIFEYMKTGRLEQRKEAVGKHLVILTNQVRKAYCSLRKFALPLPRAVALTGKHYTLHGVKPLTENSCQWNQIYPEIQVMLPIYEVPFGRRHWRPPNQPIVVDLVNSKEPN